MLRNQEIKVKITFFQDFTLLHEYQQFEVAGAGEGLNVKIESIIHLLSSNDKLISEACLRGKRKWRIVNKIK